MICATSLNKPDTMLMFADCLSGLLLVVLRAWWVDIHGIVNLADLELAPGHLVDLELLGGRAPPCTYSSKHPETPFPKCSQTPILNIPPHIKRIRCSGSSSPRPPWDGHDDLPNRRYSWKRETKKKRRGYGKRPKQNMTWTLCPAMSLSSLIGSYFQRYGQSGSSFDPNWAHFRWLSPMRGRANASN